MSDKKYIKFFPVFMGATVGVILEIIGLLIDEIVVGNLSNDAAFASVNLIEPYTYLEVFLAYLVGVGGAALIVRAHGAGDKKRMSQIFSQTIIMCAIVGFTLTAIYVIFTPQLVHVVADKPEVYKYSLEYFNVMRFYPLLDMFDTFIFTYVLYRGGYVQFYTSMVARVVINAGLSWYLGMEMGVTGIALASVISIGVALLIKLTFLFTKKHGLKMTRYLNFRDAFEIAQLGFAESALTAFIVILEVSINRFTLTKYGKLGVAAIAIVIDIFEFVLYLGEGISEYETVAINDSIGKNSKDSMDHSIKTTKKAVLIEGIALTAIILLTASLLPGAMDIDDPKTAEQATIMLMIFAPGALFICLSRVTAIFYQYTLRKRRTLILFSMSVAVCPSLLGILLGKISLEGIALGVGLGPAVAIALMYIYVRFIRKEKLFDYSILKIG
ncbi:MAG: hypothetical protein IJ889_05340 [Eubacterium sp.]|nr:hypothetical protein [Eubacterium sp.]